ncbi:helix-turn-helix transcriptional regulator [Limnoglobus roseus]|uniref:Uncharacterized protein n=1 Tax=Limnoglobus roseus TaxID=2598579 RepID=A0A5C1AEY0_9BACT|nr:hypothetical protein [Limnoglobus roseus]QEL16773.1 hypothetical protein PX52LOC_03743 [Limnoglobus roseus]
MTEEQSPLYKMRFEIELVELVTRGYTAKQVADKLAVSEFTVRRICKKHRVSVDREKPRSKPRPEHKRVMPSQADDFLPLGKMASEKPDPIRLAKESLIDAYLLKLTKPILDIRDDGFYLRGKPANLSDVMKETNRHRIGWGLEQVVTNPAWAV